MELQLQIISWICEWSIYKGWAKVGQYFKEFVDKAKSLKSGEGWIIRPFVVMNVKWHMDFNLQSKYPWKSCVSFFGAERENMTWLHNGALIWILKDKKAYVHFSVATIFLCYLPFIPRHPFIFNEIQSSSYQNTKVSTTSH